MLTRPPCESQEKNFPKKISRKKFPEKNFPGKFKHKMTDENDHKSWKDVHSGDIFVSKQYGELVLITLNVQRGASTNFIH